MTDTERYDLTIRRIDETNSEDPNSELVDGVSQPRELVYGMRMSRWVETLDPDASEALRLAVRSQHIRRWEIPRSDYPTGRAGYHKWRTTLYRFHADTVADILRDTGYDDDTIARVRELVQKRRLGSDPEVQTLEDAAALVFLEHHLDGFAERNNMDEAKAIDVIRKTWKKMTERGHQAALALSLSPESQRLVEQALS
ncbi:MAG: DUF4202 domain-containing protein [Candidatus Hydrogenedentes bacterium]|nr:DUF4202 domain-containing protein [Candidatus Hydrogenedentota bacterium]